MLPDKRSGPAATPTRSQTEDPSKEPRCAPTVRAHPASVLLRRLDGARIARYSEQAEANDRWWYDLGVTVGIREGRRQVEEELEADWRERRRISRLVPTGETGKNGWPVYKDCGPSYPTPVSFAELQRRRGVTP
jgi:hypothetical protein